jgi:murein DD-endopeptidase MepM/ murein hydrolase activator NlpD
LNGVPARPHYGVDLAAPRGTPIVAPAGGLVSFAETGLHFEGGLIMIDHGQGLVSAYLHLSRLDVVAGQSVSQGQVIGAVGAEGRATGPHLCWRMKWRDRNLNPMSLVGFRAA